MCDITKPEPPSEPTTEQYVDVLKADWEALARYRVIRTQFHPAHGKRRRLLAQGLRYADARKAAEVAEADIRREPGYCSGLMGNPIAILELEDPEATKATFRDLRARRAA